MTWAPDYGLIRRYVGARAAVCVATPDRVAAEELCAAHAAGLRDVTPWREARKAAIANPCPATFAALADAENRLMG